MARPKAGYRCSDGKQVPGVTTIIGRFKDSSALLYWAFEQGKSCERGEIAKLYDKRDEAADAGTLAHSMVEAHLDGLDPYAVCMDGQPDEIKRAARLGFENYLAWSTNNHLEVIHQEVPLVSETHRFGGCLDAIAIDANGNLCLLDWKTSNGVYADYILQLAAYKILWEENHPDAMITGGFHLSRFSKENADFTHHFWAELEDALRQFLLFRQAYDIDKILKKRVR